MPPTVWSKQAEFINAPEPTVLFSGGYGAGKTTGLLWRELRICADYPHLAHGLLGPTYKALRKDMEGPMRALLREMGFAFQENKSDHHIRPEWCTAEDAGIWFGGCDNPDALKGPNWASVGFNEPGIIKREAYEVGISRARVPLFHCADCGLPALSTAADLGFERPKTGDRKRVDVACERCGSDEVECVPNPVSLAGTPEGFNWLYDELIDRTQHPKRDWSQYRVIFADSRDCPFIAQASVDRLLDSYDERLAREKVGGEFLNIRQGRIYHAFDRERNLAELTYDPDGEILWGWDFNVDPLCSVVCQPVGDSLHVIDEVSATNGGRTAELVEEFARRYGEHRGDIRVFGDRSGYNADTRGGTRTDYAIMKAAAERCGLRRLSIEAKRKNPPRQERYALVNRMLCSAAGVVRLVLDQRYTARLARDLEQQGFKPGTLIADAGSDKSLGHAADALGYVVAARYALPRGPATFTGSIIGN